MQASQTLRRARHDVRCPEIPITALDLDLHVRVMRSNCGSRLNFFGIGAHSAGCARVCLLQTEALHGLKGHMKILAFSLIMFAALPRTALAEEALIAVASNFVTAAEELAEVFEATSDHRVVVAHGSTGSLYAQIVSGAPYDVFLSADAERPRLLSEAGLAEEVETYAFGRLILVSRDRVDLDAAADAFAGQRVALADPIVAPYGAAAISVMESLKLDTATFQPLLVTNIGQVATLFVTENADLAFLAEAQLPFVGAAEVTALEGRYPPIRQDAALLKRSEGDPAAAAFWAFLASDAAAAVIAANGYDLRE